MLLDSYAFGFRKSALRPFDEHFSPLARLLTHIVAASGDLNWSVAATLILCLSVASSCACLWMLVTLFGRRKAVLVALSLYLFNAGLMPALIWWAAAVNQVPMQIVTFMAAGWWVRYLRSHRVAPLVACIATLFVGLLAYEKVTLDFPLLWFIAINSFGEGSLFRRTWGTIKNYRYGFIITATVFCGYLIFYRLYVPQPFVPVTGGVGAVAESMLGVAEPTAMLGGPWTWWRTSPPIVLAGPPAWSIHAAWALIALVVSYSVVRRQRVAAIWLALATYALMGCVLLLASRGQRYGGLAGLEYRYVTDTITAALILGCLVFFDLPGANSPSAPQRRPLLRRPVPIAWSATLFAAVIAGGVVSSIHYIGYWHHENASRLYTKNLEAALRAGPVELADQVLPSTVMPAYTQPENRSRRFMRLFFGRVRFPRETSSLHMIGPSGKIVEAKISPDTVSGPGPTTGCGWKSTTRLPPPIPLRGVAIDPHWIQINYLSSKSTTVRVTTDRDRASADLLSGLGHVYVAVTGPVSMVRVQPMDPETTVCVDTVAAGDLTAG